MRKNIEVLGWAFIMGVAIMLGMRAINWIVPNPPVMVLVCLEDKDGPRNCKDYGSFEEASDD